MVLLFTWDWYADVSFVYLLVWTLHSLIGEAGRGEGGGEKRDRWGGGEDREGEGGRVCITIGSLWSRAFLQ